MIFNAIGRVAGTARTVLDKVTGHATQIVRGGKKDLDDVTLARKVETVVFRDRDAPKSKVDVNVADGIVQLRGEVRHPAAKEAIEGRVRAVREVRGVDNLLHLPKTPAPTRADSPGRAKRSSTESKEKTATTGRRRVTGESRTAAAEPGPNELAARGAGRQPAPFGSEDPEAKS